MYSCPSTSYSFAPSPRSTKNGAPPTRRNARTGELTPPGMSACACSNRCALVLRPGSATGVDAELSFVVMLYDIRQPCGNERTRSQITRGREVHHTIDLARLPRRARDRAVGRRFRAVHERLAAG